MVPPLIRLVLCLFPLTLSAMATTEVLVLGDSLSKEYEVEFPNFSARNWIEILDAERHDDFDIGSFEVFPLDFRATGHRYNWSFPGATADEMLDTLTGDGFFEEEAQEEITDHLKDEVKRVVIFLGGNDVDEFYRRLYENDRPERVIDRIYDRLEAILKWVKRRNDELEIVLVNVPHIGATPRVQDRFPTDAEKTGYVTQSLEILNHRLKTLAESEDVGYADVFQITLDLLEDKPFCISGRRFRNEASDSDERLFLWLGGSLANEFHPNTAGQAAVANAIIAAFNAKYRAGILPLAGTEILGGLLELETDVSYQSWIACYADDESAMPEADPDGDGSDNLTEFVLDTNPILTSDQPRFILGKRTLRYRPRVRESSYFRLILEESTDFESWASVPGAVITREPYGYFEWSAGPATRQRFLRFRIETGS